MSWASINKKIKECKRLLTTQEREYCLKTLYEATNDGMVAYALAEELESQSKLKDALKYYEEAERRFPLTKYKLLAKAAIARVKMKIYEQEHVKEGKVVKAGLQINLDLLDPETTLFVVACTKTKIWKEDPNAPLYVPAKYAYRGREFRKFIRWAKENKLEEGGFKWIILSAKYGYIEPWHPISNYDVTFDDEETGPISDETLHSQVMYQKRWGTRKLKDFKKIICIGSETYLTKIHKSFRNIDDVEIVKMDL
ncbi:MAG: DUF6884 domain-containing protein [Candidatus Asgardarchaeia archaeon]